MPGGTPTLSELAQRFAAATGMLGETDARAALCLYRLLARGVPVSVAVLAEDLDLALDVVGELVASWSGVVFDDSGSVEGFWGLTVRDIAPHRLSVNGHRLSTWCAWDTLFLPQLLGTTARVESVCPVTGAAVELVVDDKGVEWFRPEGLLVSFRDPGDGVVGDVIGTFCRFVHFLASEQAGRAWLDRHRETFTLSLTDAVELARMANAARFGALI